jgi:uncharacterized membrane protein AbrB (regulator of aidB expression)
MIILSQFFIGIGVGIHYQGITTKELSRDIIAGLGFVAVVIAIALITLLGASQISDIPLFELFLCFWPGGQAEIAVMTLAAGGVSEYYRTSSYRPYFSSHHRSSDSA